MDKGKLAIAFAGLFCLFAVYSAITEFKLPRDAEAVEPAQAIVELDPVNIQLLTQTHLFGRPPEVVVTSNNNNLINQQRKRDEENRRKQQQAQPNKATSRPIDISVTVTGLLASNDVNFSAAVLKVDNKPEKLYRIGEDLGKPEVVLQSVDRESVVIDNNGNEQIIAIKRPGLDSGNSLNNSGRNTNQPNFNRNLNEIPELPPELELPEGLEGLNNAAFEGAYSPPLPAPIEFETAEFDSLPDDIQQQLLEDQFEAELDEEARAALEAQLDDHGEIEDGVPPNPEIENNPDSPDFQMPVF